MFSAIAIALIIGASWWANWTHTKDRQNVAHLNDDDVKTAVLHARQDIKLLCFLLSGVIIMLGIIADRLPLPLRGFYREVAHPFCGSRLRGFCSRCGTLGPPFDGPDRQRPLLHMALGVETIVGTVGI